jgi:hypothetical protein
MSALLLRLASAAVLGWTRLYTRNVPPALRDARRQEVASDLWESAHDPDVQGPRLPFQILARLIIGVADDVRWRFEHVEGGLHARRRRLAFAVGAAGMLALWIAIAVIASRPAQLPQLPELRWGQRMMLVKRAPPPPPPPPPPCAPRGFPGPQTDCTR